MKRRTLLTAAAIGSTAALVPTRAMADPTTPATRLAGNAEFAGNAEIEAVAREYLTDRAARVTAVKPALSRLTNLAMTKAEKTAYGATADRLDEVRDGLNHLHGGYRKSATAVTVNGAVVDGARVTLKVTERTDLFFAQTAPQSPDHTTYWVDHELDLHKTNGQWLLARARYLPENSFSTPVTQFDDELPAAMLAERAARRARAARAVPPSGKPLLSASRSSADRKIPKTSTTRSAMATYDYEAMVRYARQWAYGRSPIFPEYDQDCTNFVSQCMWAGGWKEVGAWYQGSDRSDNSNWFYGPFVRTCSYTWGGAENWYWFATGSERTYMIYMWDMLMADVLQYDYDRAGIINHTQICTGNNESGPLMTQHGGNYADKPLAEIMQNQDNIDAWKYAHRT